MDPANSTSNRIAVDDPFVYFVATHFVPDAKQVLMKLSVDPQQGWTPTPIVEDLPHIWGPVMLDGGNLYFTSATARRDLHLLGRRWRHPSDTQVTLGATASRTSR